MNRVKQNPPAVSVRVPPPVHPATHKNNVTPPPTTRGVAEGARPRGGAQGHPNVSAAAANNNNNSNNIGGIVGAAAANKARGNNNSAKAAANNGNGKKMSGSAAAAAAAAAAAMPPPARQRQQQHPSKTKRGGGAATAARLVPADSGVSAIALAALSSPSAAALLGGKRLSTSLFRSDQRYRDQTRIHPPCAVGLADDNVAVPDLQKKK